MTLSGSQLIALFLNSQGKKVGNQKLILSWNEIKGNFADIQPACWLAVWLFVTSRPSYCFKTEGQKLNTVEVAVCRPQVEAFTGPVRRNAFWLL